MFQQLIVGVIVLGAAVFVGRKMWLTVASARAPKHDASCGSGCGCAPAAPSRRGEEPVRR